MARFSTDAGRRIGMAARSIMAGAGAYVRGQVGPMRARASGAWRAASYEDPAMMDWRALNREPNREIALSRNEIVARVRDLDRNDGWASAGLDHQVDRLAGGGFRLSMQIDAGALGLDPEVAADTNRAIEAEWRRYAEGPTFGCDLRRMHRFSQLTMLGFLHRLRDGENFAAAVWRPHLAPGADGYATRLAIVDPDRCSTPLGKAESPRLRSGVALDGDGGPIGYHFRDAHPADLALASAQTWSYWQRFDELGLPVVMHDFRARRAGQVRGMTDLAPIVRVFKQLGRYGDAELDRAVIEAFLAMTIETQESSTEIEDRLGGQQARNAEVERAGVYAEAPVMVGGVQAMALRPGDTLKFNSPSRVGGAFGAFESSLLGKIATKMGMSKESLTKDWSKTNYSSARAGILETRQWIRTRRNDYIASTVQPFFLTWMAEGVDRGLIKLPIAKKHSFESRPEAWSRANWITPGLGWVDPVKEADGVQRRVMYGLSTLQKECAENGDDFEENADQLQREVAYFKARGLKHPAEREATPQPAEVRVEKEAA